MGLPLLSRFDQRTLVPRAVHEFDAALGARITAGEGGCDARESQNERESEKPPRHGLSRIFRAAVEFID